MSASKLASTVLYMSVLSTAPSINVAALPRSLESSDASLSISDSARSARATVNLIFASYNKLY